VLPSREPPYSDKTANNVTACVFSDSLSVAASTTTTTTAAAAAAAVVTRRRQLLTRLSSLICLIIVGSFWQQYATYGDTASRITVVRTLIHYRARRPILIRHYFSFDETHYRDDDVFVVDSAISSVVSSICADGLATSWLAVEDDAFVECPACIQSSHSEPSVSMSAV